MNNQFLIGSAQLNHAFESNSCSGGGGQGSEITRRSFIKRTGGATVATLVVLNSLTVNAKATPGQANHCSTHGSSCAWIKSVKVDLNDKMNPHPDPNHPERSGAVFTGTLIYTVEYCIPGGNTGTYDSDPIDVTSGGFLLGNKHMVKGVNNDTVIPGKNYDLSLNPQPVIMGFDFIPQPPHRTAIELHDRQRPKGSSGCIAFTDAAGEGGPWDTFYDLMLKNKKPCPHSPPNPVPITLTYSGVTPNNVWKPGHKNQPPCNNC